MALSGNGPLNFKMDAWNPGDENTNHNVQTSPVLMAKNSVPCRRAMTPRQRNSICSDPDQIVKEARFQKEVVPFGQRTRSTVDIGYMEPIVNEKFEKSSRDLRGTFYKPTPIITEKGEAHTIAADEELSVSSPRVRPQSPRVSGQSPRIRPMTPTKKEKCGTPVTADLGYVSPAEGSKFACSLRPSTPERCKTWQPSLTQGTAPNLSPRRERRSSTGTIGEIGTIGETPEPRLRLQRPTSAEARRRPATPEKKERPSTPNRRAPTPDRKSVAKTEATVKVLTQSDAPIPAGPQRRELEAMKKHLQRRSAANQCMQHASSAAPDLQASASAVSGAAPATTNRTAAAARIFDAREKAALAKHLERAAVSAQQKAKTQRAPLTMAM